MPNALIPHKKQIAIGRLVLRGKLNIRQCARMLNVTRNTVKKYAMLYQQVSSDEVPGIINSQNLPVFNTVQSFTPKQKELLSVLPELALASREQESTKTTLWLKYLELVPGGQGYGFSRFCDLYTKWQTEMEGPYRPAWQVQSITPDDMIMLESWRNCSDRRNWERAVTILESFKNRPVKEIAEKVERSVERIHIWIKAYKTEGIKGLQKKPRTPDPAIITRQQEKLANLIRLLHETPKLHGINRTSWFLADLSATYLKVYGTYISTSSISAYLRKEGYVYRKAREVLTSPDPDFRIKMDHIKNILSNLGPKEKFFSVDEFGPFAVKIKGGRSLVKRGERKTFPQIQKSKGFTICTAALELSTNQITHFFSQKKDTEEMIKLIDMLILKYRGEEKLYFSWDAASWHASKKLNKHLEYINEECYRQQNNTPFVALAPLPASAQFLNVIESVFSGLAKSIIHNSDYSSLDECKSAITQYFKTRNEHYIANPHRAGNKIWGKERVSPEFTDTNNCKDPKYR